MDQDKLTAVLPHMKAVAMRMLRNEQDAQDAVQSAVLKMLAAQARGTGLNGSSSLKTWAHRCVINACIDLTRKAQPVWADVSTIEEPGLDQHRNLEAARAIDCLSASQQKLLQSYLKGLSYSEMSEQTGRPVRTLRV